MRETLILMPLPRSRFGEPVENKLVFSVAQIEDLHAVAVRHDLLAVDEELDRSVGIPDLDIKDGLLALDALFEVLQTLCEGIVICKKNDRILVSSRQS